MEARQKMRGGSPPDLPAPSEMPVRPGAGKARQTLTAYAAAGDTRESDERFSVYHYSRNASARQVVFGIFPSVADFLIKISFF